MLLTVIVFISKPLFAADTNTVSSTVVTNNTPSTANAPSVVINNSDICKTAASTAVQTQILGLATGVTITDENCERIKLSRSLYSMGMKVAAVSTLCADPRVWDAMYMAGTYCPYMGAIGEDAEKGWKENRKVIKPSEYEVKKNRRSRSAKLRWVFRSSLTLSQLNSSHNFINYGGIEC